MRIKVLYIALLFLSHFLFSQDDVTVKGNLPIEVSESSGLIFYNNRLITHGDSGNAAKLYELDTTSLQIVREVNIENARNVDWEDMTQDGQYIYVGDFGNNFGTRQDLVIYRISKESYDSSNMVNAEPIYFSYPEQEDFTNTGNSDWDAEALVVFGDQLLVFTKQWVSQGTSAYAVPKSPGTYEAVKLGSYDIGGLLTGATQNLENGTIYATAYSETLFPFLIKLDGFSAASPFDGTIQRVNLDIGLAQIEGITYVDTRTYVFSSEKVSLSFPPIQLPSQLFSFSETEVVDGEDDDPTEEDEEEEMDDGTEENPDDAEGGLGQDPTEIGDLDNDAFLVFRQWGSDWLEFRLGKEKTPLGYAIFDVTGKRIQEGTQTELEDYAIDVSALRPSYYYLTVYLGNDRRTKAFFKD
ncbi:MAG: hypothetical protein AAFX53_00985 [Bacteroidota bacterium]